MSSLQRIVCQKQANRHARRDGYRRNSLAAYVDLGEVDTE